MFDPVLCILLIVETKLICEIYIISVYWIVPKELP